MQAPDYTEIYNGDRHCLMCRWACPVERVTRSEATSPHGWALLIASVQRGLLTWNSETVDTLYKCADCGLCQANCATDRPLPAAIVAARASVVEKDLMPESVRQLDALLRANGSPYEAPAGQVGAASQTKGGTVGLYVGAASYAKNPGVVRAAARIMQAAGVSAQLLDTERSGVYLPYTVGLWDTARTFAEQTLAEIGRMDITQVVTLTKEDAHAFLHIYPELGVALPENLRVTPFIDWLLGVLESGTLKVGKIDLGGSVFHDACHTPRLNDSWAASRKVLSKLAGQAPDELFWSGRQASPCGAIGGFEFTQPRLAEALAVERIGEARNAGATAIITDDPQCAAHLAKYADGLPVRSLSELVLEQLAGE